MAIPIPVHEHGNVQRIVWADCVLQGFSPEQIRDGILEMLEHRPQPRLLINLEDVESLSSATLGGFLTIRKRLEESGGELRLSRLNRRVAEVFRVTNLTGRFQVHPDDDAALASFK